MTGTRLRSKVAPCICNFELEEGHNGMSEMQRLDADGANGQFLFSVYAWKCINCGALIDKTIANNRRKCLATKALELAKVG